jgi:hypothetical protein
MAEKEMILELGIEGGGASLYRTPLASGGWLFQVEGTSMFLDDNDDEDWRAWTKEPVQTLEEALRSITGDGSWVLFFPTSVHPEYRTSVFEHAQEAASKLPDTLIPIWERRREEWQSLCLEES